MEGAFASLAAGEMIRDLPSRFVILSEVKNPSSIWRRAKNQERFFAQNDNVFVFAAYRGRRAVFLPRGLQSRIRSRGVDDFPADHRKEGFGALDLIERRCHVVGVQHCEVG